MALQGSLGWKGARGWDSHVTDCWLESSTFQRLCFLSPAFSICQGRPGPGFTLDVKALRQDVPLSLPATLFLPRVPRSCDKDQPHSNGDSLGSPPWCNRDQPLHVLLRQRPV